MDGTRATVNWREIHEAMAPVPPVNRRESHQDIRQQIEHLSLSQKLKNFLSSLLTVERSKSFA
jgi:hypothetical protein